MRETTRLWNRVWQGMLTIILLFAFSSSSFGQTVTTIDFETLDDGYTASATEGSSNIDVFNRVNPNIGGNSSYIWACEDMSLSNPSLTLDQIDISGATSFTFSVDFLTPNSNDWDAADELLITYSIDGGGSQNLMWVQADDDDDFNEPACLDLAFDGAGDDGQELPAIADDHSAGVGGNFATFSTSDIAISGTTLDITLQFNGLTSTAEGIYLDDIKVSVTAGSTPTITVSESSLTNFDYAEGAGPSSSQMFTVEGTNLTADITVTPPTNYEISTDDASFQGTAITLTQSGGDVATTTIYTRLESGLAAASYNEDITCASTGATDKTISCSGTVAAPGLTITAPNGGESWMQGSTQSITWNSVLVGNPTNVKIEIASDGSTYTTLIASTENDGSYDWVIPSDQTIASAYKVKVSDAADGDPVDESDASFDIVESVKVIFSEIAGKGQDANYNDEYIELINIGSSSVDLTDYELKYYESSLEKTLTLTGSIAANSTYVVAVRTSYTAAITPDFVPSSGFSLNNAGYVELFDSGAMLIDAAGSSSDKFSKDVNYKFTSCSGDNSVVNNWINLGTDNGTPGTVECDNDAPVVTFDPLNAATNVAIGVNPTITFDEDVYKAADGSSFTTDEDVTGLLSFFETATPANTVAFTATINGKVITIVPTANLDYEIEYTITLAAASVEDASGNENIETSASFTTLANTAPVISDVAITEAAPYYAGDDVTVTWTSANITNINIYVYIPGTDDTLRLHENVTATDGSKVVTIDPNATYSTDYKVIIADASDTTLMEASSTFEIRGVADELSDLRDYHSVGHIVKYTGDALVSFTQSYRNQKFIQDASGGIVIDDDAGTITSPYVAGDQMSELEGTISEYNNMLQLVPVTDPGAATATGQTIPATVLTISELNSNFDAYEAMLVTVEGVTFTDANGVTTFENGTEYDINDGTETFSFRTTYNDMDFIGSVITSDKVDVTGILNARSDGNFISSIKAANIVDNYGPVPSFGSLDGATNVNPDEDIEITFTEAIYKDASQTAFGADEEVTTGLKFYTNNTKALTPLAADFTALINGTTVSIEINSPLPEESNVVLEVQSGFFFDASGNDAGTESVQFETGKLVDVTFNVDMSIEFYDNAWDSTATALDISGDFDGWAGEKMYDTNKDLTYTVVIPDQLVGSDIEFRYRKNGAADQETSTRTYTVIDGTNEFTAFYNNEVPTEAAEFKYFKVAGEANPAEILTAKDSVYVTVLFGTDVSNLTPDFDVSPGAMVTPTTIEAQDFTSDVKYTIASYANSIIKEWWVHVDVLTEPNHSAEIEGFTFVEQTGAAVIDAGSKTISIEVEWDADVTMLVPAISISGGATISPLSGVAQDFTNPVVYTVTAEDGTTTKDWTVTVTKQEVADVTFNVNMNKQINLGNFIAGTDSVRIAATFNSFGADTCMDANTDGIYSFTALNQIVGAAVEFKFQINETSELDAQPSRSYTVVSGTNEITVWYNNVELGTEALVTSTTYDVDDLNETITNIPFGTGLATFESNLEGVNGASFKLYQPDASTAATDVQTGYVLIATSEDLANTKNYTVTVEEEVVGELFFSEYIEGGSNNKALEIYNGTGSNVDLSNYVIRINSNGSEWSSVFEFPVGTMIANKDVYVMAHADADAVILAETDTAIINPYSSGTSYLTVFNGDDVRGLFKVEGNDTNLVDLIGLYDLTDPGSGWAVAGTADATKDHTLVRKSTVTAGNTDWTLSAGTDADDSEWIVYDKDELTYIGSHVQESDETAPIATFTPENSATNVVVTTDVTISFNETVYKAVDGSEFTDNEDVSAYIEFYETAIPANTVVFAATISGNVITIIPDADLANELQYTVVLKANSVEDKSGNNVIETLASFTTIDAATPVITLTSPTGGEKYYAGDTPTITWTSANVDSIKIEVFDPENETWTELVAKTDATDGSEVVTIDADAAYGNTYKVRISDVTDAAVVDSSNAFEIIAVAANLTELRANHVGDKVKLTGSSVVTWAQEYRGQKFIQDADAAILIDDASTIIASTYVIGDQMPGFEGTIGEYGDMLQFVPTTDPGAPIANGVAVAVQTITVNEFTTNFENYEAELISFEAVDFSDANGTDVFANGTAYNITDGVNTAKFYTNFYDVDYIGNVIPETTGKITGLAISRTDGVYISSREASEMVFPSNDATLSDLTVGGTTIEGFDAAVVTYTIELAYGTTEIPVIAAVANDANADAITIQATELPGAATVVITAEDAETVLTYTVNFTIAPNNDATLSVITIDGEALAGFDAATYTYYELLSYGSDIPVVAGIANDENATVTVTQATELPGTAAILVLAEDGTTELTYSIEFDVMPNTDATLSDLTVDGETIGGFDPEVLTYNIELAYGTTDIPVVGGTTNDPNAVMQVSQATELPGKAEIGVFAEDNQVLLIYTVNFTIGAQPTYMVTFTVVDEGDEPIVGASVEFNETTVLTNEQGIAIFEEVAPITDASYNVSINGPFVPGEGTVTVIDQDVEVKVVLIHVSVNDSEAIVSAIYPNPTSGEINIQLHENISHAVLTITNVNGKVIENREISEMELNVDLSTQEAGVYFIRIVNENNSYLGKVILK